MASRSERNLFQRMRDVGEEQMNRAFEELASSPRFSEFLDTAVRQAMATKGQLDRNMQAILTLLNLPSKSDYKKLSTKVEALQGSLVNLNIKLDRLLAGQGQTAKRTPRSRARSKE